MAKNANEYVNIIYFYHVVQIYDIKLHSSPSSGILRTINVVEHCTGIAEVWVRIPSRPEFSCLSCVYTWSTKCFYRNTLDHCDYQNVTLFTRASICCQHVVPVSVTNHSFQVVVSSLKGFIHWANIFGAGKIRPSLIRPRVFPTPEPRPRDFHLAVPSGQDSSILPAGIVSHSAGFDSSCPRTELTR